MFRCTRPTRTPKRFILAKECAAELGLDLRGIEARGASDLNWVGSVNANVIEALGACGGGAHSARA